MRADGQGQWQCRKCAMPFLPAETWDQNIENTGRIAGAILAGALQQMGYGREAPATDPQGAEKPRSPFLGAGEDDGGT